MLLAECRASLNLTGFRVQMGRQNLNLGQLPSRQTSYPLSYRLALIIPSALIMCIRAGPCLCPLPECSGRTQGTTYLVARGWEALVPMVLAGSSQVSSVHGSRASSASSVSWELSSVPSVVKSTEHGASNVLLGVP